MTLVRKMIIATGSLASVATMAQAQYAFPAFNQNGAGAIGTTWQEFNLGTAPAGTYTSYLVVMDWTGPNTTMNQWSNEVDISMGANSTGALGTANTGPSSTFVSPRYVVNAASATGSAGNVNPANNMYWTGNLSTSFVSTGANNLSFYSHQSFGATGNGSHNNVRVILNPVNTITTTGIAVPGSFTDLGTLSIGRTTNSVTQATANQLNWFRFVLPVGVQNDNVNGALDTLLDIDTQGSGGGILDTEMRLYRLDTLTGRLVPAGTGAFGSGADAHADDDDGGVPAGGTSSYLSQLTYGDTNTGAWAGASQRNYGYALPTAGPEAYNGRDGSLVAGEYYLLATDYNVTETGTTVATIGATGLIANTTWSVASSGAGGLGTINVNIAFVPTPGSAGLIGLGMLAAARRRRV